MYEPRPAPLPPSAPLQRPEDAPPWTLPFSWRDGAFVAVYAGTLVLGLPVAALLGLLMLAGIRPDLKDPLTGALLQTGVYTLIITAFCVLLWPDVRRAARRFTSRPGLAWGLTPAFWLGNVLILTAVGALMNLVDPNLSESANQQGLADLAKKVPFPIMAVSTVVFAPLVEEYVFRNLLLGKLSRVVSQWIALPVSALAFTVLHALAGWPENPLTLLPYLVMGLNFGVIYILSGKSFLASALVHGLHNLMALSLLYVAPTSLPT